MKYDDMGSMVDMEIVTPVSINDGEVEFDQPDFMISDDEVEDVSETMEISISISDIMELISKSFTNSPELVGMLATNYIGAIDNISDFMEKHYNVGVDNLSDVIDNSKKLKNYLVLVSQGVLVGKGFIKTVPSQIKVMIAKPSETDDMGFVKSSKGVLYKGVPIMTSFSEADFNVVVSKFFGKRIKNSISNPFQFFVERVPEIMAKRETRDDITLVLSMTPLELVEYVRSGNISVEQLNELDTVGMDKSKINKVNALLKVLETSDYS